LFVFFTSKGELSIIYSICHMTWKTQGFKNIVNMGEGTLRGWTLDLQVMTSLRTNSKQLASSVHDSICMNVFFYKSSWAYV